MIALTARWLLHDDDHHHEDADIRGAHVHVVANALTSILAVGDRYGMGQCLCGRVA